MVIFELQYEITLKFYSKMKNLTQKIILTFLVGLAFINQKEVVAQSFYDEKLYLFTWDMVKQMPTLNFLTTLFTMFR